MIIWLESLGCSRNQVDSEIMASHLIDAGHIIGHDPSKAEVIIINTCAFISDAAEEAIDTILEMAQFKINGKCQCLIVTGCLPERYKEDNLISSLPEVDAFLGTGAIDRIVQAVEGSLNKQKISCRQNVNQQNPEKPKGIYETNNTCEEETIKKKNGIISFFPDPCKRKFQSPPFKRKLTLNYSAYIKISEGCSRKCTYCIIPKLRGIQRSRPIEDIVEETKYLIQKGVKEIILTGENTTDYGFDFYNNPKQAHDYSGYEFCPVKDKDQSHSKLTGSGMSNDNKIDLTMLLEKISEEIDKIADMEPARKKICEPIWLRLLYTHPSSLSPKIIECISKLNYFCNYYDVPIQHASTKILKKMGRSYTKKELYSLFNTIKKTDKNASLRTTIITGFPGETQDDFNILLNFIKDIEFDHLGVFTYSDSHDLKSHNLKNHVPKDLALERQDILMAEQAKISEKINLRHFGKTYKVLVEENPDKGIYIGRTSFQAPEVDGITFIYGSDLEIGTFVDVKITETYEYDLAGEAKKP